MNAPTKENIFKGFLIDIIFKILLNFETHTKSILKNDRWSDLLLKLEIHELVKIGISANYGELL